MVFPAGALMLTQFTKGLCDLLQVKLLLQPLKGQDIKSGDKQLCLLDFLSTLQPVRQGVIHTVLSCMVELSCPGATPVMHPPAPKMLEALSPRQPAAAIEALPDEAVIEGMHLMAPALWLPLTGAPHDCSFFVDIEPQQGWD